MSNETNEQQGMWRVDDNANLEVWFEGEWAGLGTTWQLSNEEGIAKNRRFREFRNAALRQLVADHNALLAAPDTAAEAREWRVNYFRGEYVAANGQTAPGTEVRNLAGMCELANALTARVRELEKPAEAGEWRVDVGNDGLLVVGPDFQYDMSEEDGIFALVDIINALTARVAEAERERDDWRIHASSAEGGIEKLKNLIDAHQWLAEGRGPYTDTDGHYDEEVRGFVQSLVDALPPGRWEPWQTVLNKLDRAEARVTKLRQALERAEEKFQRIQNIALPDTMIMARAGDGEDDARAALQDDGA